MTNEEAKALYEEAKAFILDRNYESALKTLEVIERERPNSRRVAQNRILCLIRLGKYAHAEHALEKLRNRIAPENYSELKDMLTAALHKEKEDASDQETPEEEINSIFMVEAVYPLSISQSTVMGYMEAGEVYAQDKLYVRGTEAPILRLGPEDKPIRRLLEGEHGIMLLGANPNLITAGAPLRVISMERDPLGDKNDLDDSLNISNAGQGHDAQESENEESDNKTFFSEGSKLVFLLILLLILIIIIGLYDIWSWNQPV